MAWSARVVESSVGVRLPRRTVQVGRGRHEHPSSSCQVRRDHLGRALSGSDPRERTFDRKADAQRFERDVRHRLDTDQYLDPDSARITMGEWAERWWPTIVNSQRAPSTISGYEGALRLYVLPHLGDRRIADAPADRNVEEWLGELRNAGYSNSTIHGARTVAGMIFASALDARIIASNPLAGLRLPMTSSKTRHALTVEQVEAIAETVDPWWRPLCPRPGLLRPATR